jgi:DNA (cytosine-5)-methyltransferase 1
VSRPSSRPSFLEFFAGGGMARAGLGDGWSCLFANDFDARKAAAYRDNWGADEIKLGDIADLTAADLPGWADLAWGSFPCQDLSLAGAQAGLGGHRSGTFFPFWRLIRALGAEGRGPPLVALENVCGTLTSDGGRDFEAIAEAFSDAGYAFGALVIDAALFTPQSRPRLFMVGVRQDLAIPSTLRQVGPTAPFHTPALVAAVGRLSPIVRSRFIWWRLSVPPPRVRRFADEIEAAPCDVAWHRQSDTDRLLGMMSPLNRAKVEAARSAGGRQVGAVYRRTRVGPDGGRMQRAEVRFDDTAGCLRTPAGGSSRQTLLVVDGPLTRSRLISARETARLMGLPDSYRLPKGYTDAYHLTGDGVVAPVVRRLAQDLFEPLIAEWNPIVTG